VDPGCDRGPDYRAALENQRDQLIAAYAPAIVSSSDEEWNARVELAAAYRVFDMLGWTELIYNHISLRVPGPETHFLIKPFGLHYSEVTASNLVKIDLAGKVVGDRSGRSIPAGFTDRTRRSTDGIPEAHCVMHTHTTAGLGVACLEDGLSMSNFYSAQLHGKVRVSRLRRASRSCRRRSAAPGQHRATARQ
jgi:ribulose-5-phosphate 4-epimerase/fuculose-1-phosphate aldolase